MLSYNESNEYDSSAYGKSAGYSSSALETVGMASAGDTTAATTAPAGNDQLDKVPEVSKGNLLPLEVYKWSHPL